MLLLNISNRREAEIRLTQSDGSQSVVPGQTVSITCKASSYVSDDVNWYLQKPGEVPKLLIHDATYRLSGVSDRRFTGSGSNTDFTLSISGVQAEDAAVYYYLCDELMCKCCGGETIQQRPIIIHYDQHDIST
uniref:Ig-like domain-containing protein n=1 Tax=Stegastes partitus TaxID=144197 RepID=A0A3B5BHU9_9TELE